MPTVINNPTNSEGAGGVVGALVGIVIFVLVLVLFFLYALPMIRNSNSPAQEAPKANSLDVNVTIPKTKEPAQ